MLAAQNSTEDRYQLQANVNRFIMKNINQSESNFTSSPAQVTCKISKPFDVSELMEARQRARIATLRIACQNYFTRFLQCEPKEQYILERNVFSKTYKVRIRKYKRLLLVKFFSYFFSFRVFPISISINIFSFQINTIDMDKRF